MPAIPTLATPDVRSAPLAAAPRSLTGDQAQLQGRMALGESIQQVGSTIENAVLLSQQAKNEADLTRAKLAMDRHTAELQTDLEQDPNPANWNRITEERLQAAAGEIFASEEGARLSAPVRRQLETEFKGYAQRTSEAIRWQALRQQNKDNDAVFAQAQAREVASGSLDGANHYLDLRERIGLISSGRAQIERQEIAHGVDVQLVSRAINDDPQAAIEQLEDRTEGGKYRYFKNLSETDRIAAVRSAKNARETARAETAQGLSEEIYAGGAQAFGIEKRIDDAVAQGAILPSQANNLKRLARGTYTPEQQAATGAALWQQAMALKPGDADYVQKSMRIRSELHTLSEEIKKPILQTLDQVDHGSVTEDVRNAHAALDRDFRANRFGNVQTFTASEAVEFNDMSERQRKKYYPGIDPTRKVAEGDPKNPKEFETASEKLWRNKDAFTRWIGAHPQATFEEMSKYRAQLTATDRSADLNQQAIDDLSRAVQ